MEPAALRILDSAAAAGLSSPDRARERQYIVPAAIETHDFGFAAPIESQSGFHDVEGLIEEMETDRRPHTFYRCKRCRRIVASQDNIVPHKQGQGESCFKWKKRDDPHASKRPECSSIFVEPMKWMHVDGNVEEKLWCIGCKARLGSFNWAGMQCSCGAWVTPAFQLHKSRVDESTH